MALMAWAHATLASRATDTNANYSLDFSRATAAGAPNDSRTAPAEQAIMLTTKGNERFPKLD